MSNWLHAFKDPAAAAAIADRLGKYRGRPLAFMEVCGTHTMSVHRYGIRSLLPDNIRLVSGPGCPVCVTPVSYVDAAVDLSAIKNVTLATFGDLMRVPGSASSLASEKAKGADIRMVYSPLDAVKLAAEKPERKVVFLSVGFETTTPAAALAILQASDQRLENFFVLTANKTMPEALRLLAKDREVQLDGFLYPGHVSVIIGTRLFEELAEEFGISGVVAGFEPLDILHALLTLTGMAGSGVVRAVNEYSRVVKPEGNLLAQEKVQQVFEPCDAVWRGMGIVPGSGLTLRSQYTRFDAWKVYGLSANEGHEPAGCLCGEILKGKQVPTACRWYGNRCTPQNPVGACMVSSEGTCAAHYRYSAGSTGSIEGGTLIGR